MNFISWCFARHCPAISSSPRPFLFPEHVIVEILKNLTDIRTYSSCSIVCREFKKITYDDLTRAAFMAKFCPNKFFPLTIYEASLTMQVALLFASSWSYPLRFNVGSTLVILSNKHFIMRLDNRREVSVIKGSLDEKSALKLQLVSSTESNIV